MTDKGPPPSLKDLTERLERAQAQHRPPEDGAKRGSAMGLAFRLSIELVVGLVVGGGIGWALDTWLGTMPLFLLLFFVLGAAAGVRNVIRTAQEMSAAAERERQSE